MLECMNGKEEVYVEDKWVKDTTKKNAWAVSGGNIRKDGSADEVQG